MNSGSAYSQGVFTLTRSIKRYLTNSSAVSRHYGASRSFLPFIELTFMGWQPRAEGSSSSGLVRSPSRIQRASRLPRHRTMNPVAK